jgi:hypothetical protein
VRRVQRNCTRARKGTRSPRFAVARFFSARSWRATPGEGLSPHPDAPELQNCYEDKAKKSGDKTGPEDCSNRIEHQSNVTPARRQSLKCFGAGLSQTSG